MNINDVLLKVKQVANKQDKTDSRLLTNSKEIVGAINENKSSLEEKVNKEQGKGLSTHDYDDTEKSEVAKVKNKAEITYVDTKVSQIVSGSPKGIYTNLSALQSAKPNGDTGIYVTTDNGNWYYWNGSSWKSGGVYQSQGINNDDILNAMLVNNNSDRFIKSNNIINGYDITSTDNWGYGLTNSVLSVVNKKIRSTSQGQVCFIGQIDLNIPVGHKIYFRTELKGSKSGNINIGMSNDDSFSRIDTTAKKDFGISTVAKEYSVIFTNTEVCEGIRVRGSDFAVTGDFIEIDRVILVDLTELFGSGNEPNKEYMDCYMFAYNNNILDLNSMLDGKIINTIEQPILENGQIKGQKILSKHLDFLREDLIDIDNSYITETRTLKNGLNRTLKTNLTTLETEVI